MLFGHVKICQTFMLLLENDAPLDGIFDKVHKGTYEPAHIRKAPCAFTEPLANKAKPGERVHVVRQAIDEFQEYWRWRVQQCMEKRLAFAFSR